MKKIDYTIDILNISGDKVADFELDKDVFDGSVNKELLHQVITSYLANKRQGTASTKTKGEVSGGGRKPWKQKGTGRARVGSNRSPIWRGGGTVFGPRMRDYSVRIPKKMKIEALKSSLNAKLLDQELILIEDFQMDEPKTSSFVKIVKDLKLDKLKTLFVSENVSDNLYLSSRNIEGVFVKKSINLNAYDVLNCKKIVLSKEALSVVGERIKKK
ncbi:MAG: 50S ribosomal protein L4 [Candidatus Kaelpia aquatica]|nr:50S ribosomal protein L4 [Candidatus Kaelpia aquatica]